MRNRTFEITEKSLKALKSTSLIRVVDDEEVFRNSMIRLLKYNGWKTAGFSSASDLLSQNTPSIPGCILWDIRMPGMSGLELQLELKKQVCTIPIVFLTAHGDIDMAVDSLHLGAFDFLQKTCTTEKILTVIANACRTSIENSGMNKFLCREEAIQALNTLTQREFQIFKLFAKGMTAKQVGEYLNISERTVGNHRTSACKRLGVHSTEEVLKMMRFAGLEN